MNRCVDTESNATSIAADQESTLGLDVNVASALAYFPLPLLGFIVPLAGFVVPLAGLVLLFVQESNEFVRFHAAQSAVMVLVIMFVRFSRGFVGPFRPAGIGLLWDLFMGFVDLGFLLVLIFLAYKAYSGNRFELPVVSDVTELLLDGL